MTSFTQGPLPWSIFFGTFTSVSELAGFIKSRVSLCQGGRQEHVISQGFFFPSTFLISVHYMWYFPFFPPTQDIKYVFHLKILMLQPVLAFLAQAEEIHFFTCTVWETNSMTWWRESSTDHHFTFLLVYSCALTTFSSFPFKAYIFRAREEIMGNNSFFRKRRMIVIETDMSTR